MIGRSIDELYFGYRPVAGHADDCASRGSNVWEVTRFTERAFDGEARRTTIRYACHQCGVVAFDGTDGEMTFEGTHASQVGYGSRPEKVLGVWLYPGSLIWMRDDRGPTVYLVTASREVPQRPEGVLGKVGWGLGPRGGIQWSAGIGCTGHGTVKISCEDQRWSSRRAAVAWVLANVDMAATVPGGAR